MSEHTDRILHSGAVSNLRECVELLGTLSEVDWENEGTQDLIVRLTTITKSVLGRLTIADRNLVPINTVDDLDSHIQWILDTVRNLTESAPSLNIDLSAANSQIDGILTVASALPVVPIRTTSLVLERAAEQFDREASSARTAISAEVDSLRTVIAGFRQQIHSTVQQSNHKLAETQSTTESLNARISDATEQLQREVTSIQEVFRNSQNQRDTEFNEHQANRDREFHESLDSTIEDIKRFRDEANKMLEEVAGAGTAAHYVGHSKQQNKAANLWRWIGVGALLIMVFSSGWVFYEYSQTEQEFSVAWLIARTGLWGSMLIFAFYALRQSGKHRQQAENAGRLANELQLLWPFMNRLPSDHKEALLLEITPLYFKGQSSEDPKIEKQGPVRTLLDKLVKSKMEGE